MNPLFAAAVEFQVLCARRGWRSSVTGGVAVQRWGDHRQTRDVDLTLLTGLGGEEAFVDLILEHYRGRMSDARRFALERRVLLVETGDGVPLDISLGGLLYEAVLVDRSTPFEIAPGISLSTCSAEDLVILKAFAGPRTGSTSKESSYGRARTLREASRLTRLAPMQQANCGPDLVARRLQRGAALCRILHPDLRNTQSD